MKRKVTKLILCFILLSSSAFCYSEEKEEIDEFTLRFPKDAEMTVSDLIWMLVPTMTFEELEKNLPETGEEIFYMGEKENIELWFWVEKERLVKREHGKFYIGVDPFKVTPAKP